MHGKQTIWVPPPLQEKSSGRSCRRRASSRHQLFYTAVLKRTRGEDQIDASELQSNITIALLTVNYLEMSGFEALGLISSIISIIDASLEIYTAIKDASNLPSSFRDVASRLPAIQATLREASDGIYTDRSNVSIQTMKASLETCKKRAEELEHIFREAVPPSGGPRMLKAFKAIKTMSKSERVLALNKGILEDLQVLTASQAMQAASRAQMERLTETVERGYLRNGRSSISIGNSGSGKQIIHCGIGDQHTNGGLTLSGVFHGPLYYTISR